MGAFHRARRPQAIAGPISLRPLWRADRVFGRFVALLRAFAALLAGANGLAPWRFFAFNAAGGIVWATTFGLGGYLLGAGIHRIAGPVGWALLIAALIAGFVLWRYYKKHEENLLAKAEDEMARQGR